MARSYPYVDQLVKSGKYPMFTKMVMEARQPHLSRDDQFRSHTRILLAGLARLSLR